MSPEAVQHKESVTLQSDVWAVGVVLYAMLFDRFPFQGKTDKELYANIANQPLAVPSWTSEEMVGLLGGLLAKDWKERLTVFQLSEKLKKREEDQ